jgi:hypothetical protein
MPMLSLLLVDDSTNRRRFLAWRLRNVLSDTHREPDRPRHPARAVRATLTSLVVGVCAWAFVVWLVGLVAGVW